MGGTFEGSMTKDFEDGKRLYEIADTPVIARNRIFLNKPVKCRYIRYKADNDKYAELAEMTFYANGKAVSPIAVWGSPTEKEIYMCWQSMWRMVILFLIICL